MSGGVRRYTERGPRPKYVKAFVALSRAARFFPHERGCAEAIIEALRLAPYLDGPLAIWVYNKPEGSKGAACRRLKFPLHKDPDIIELHTTNLTNLTKWRTGEGLSKERTLHWQLAKEALELGLTVPEEWFNTAWFGADLVARDPTRQFTDHHLLVAMKMQQGRCLACQAPFSGLIKPVADHIVPWSAGGLTIQENCAALCVRCNTAKGVKPISQWLTEFLQLQSLGRNLVLEPT